MSILGIDPGLTGGLVQVSYDGELVNSWRMPVIKDSKAYVIEEIAAILNSIGANPRVVCESGLGWNHPQAAKLLAKFEGIIETLCWREDIPLKLVVPRVWQKPMLASTKATLKPKARVEEVMRREFDAERKQLDKNLWDAFLIAMWGLRHG